MFTRGYEETREKIKSNPKFHKSCFNCNSYYQAVGDKEECCQNNNVTKYDMTVTSTNAYCIYWEPVKSKEKNLFKKKGGRSILD